MNSTHEYTLEQLGTFEKSYSFSRALEGNGEYRHIHYGDIHTKLPSVIQHSEILPTITENQNFDIVKYGDILIADASEDYKDLGKAVCFLDSTNTKVISGLHTHRFRPNSLLIKPEYLINLFQTNRYRKFVWRMGTGVSVLGLSKTNLAKYTLTIPCLDEQEKIAEHFMNVNKKIQLQQEKINLLKEQKKSFMQKIFSQELRFKDEDGKEFPNWKNVFINDVCEVGSCTRVHQKDWTSNGIPFFRARDIVAINNGEETNPLFISEETYKEKSSKSGIVKKGDVMITGVGTIGVPYLIQHDDPIYFKDGNVIWLKNSNKINGKFLYYTILSQEVQNFIKTTSGLGTVGTYTIDNAKKTPLRLPCSNEQNKIVLFLDKIYEKIKVENKKMHNLTEQKKAFMQQMFI